MKVIVWLILIWPFLAIAQDKGIHFEEHLTLREIEEKARIENKYIFFDCFTTWCAPCRKMEKEVYANSVVGDYFNDKIISVKVQMDKTKDDNDRVKAWYADASLIEAKYGIRSYPSYVFLSPAGETVHIEGGFKSPEDFIRVAEVAVTRGKAMGNPYTRFDDLVKNWKSGYLELDDLPYMIVTAQKLKDSATCAQLMIEYKARMKVIARNKLYMPEHIRFMASVISGSDSEFFAVFYNDGKRINQLMNKKWFSEYVVDKVIVAEDVRPFLNAELNQMQTSSNARNSQGPDWNKLYRSIYEKYGSKYAQRNVLEAKIIWLRNQKNVAYTKLFVHKWKKYGFDTTEDVDLRLNSVAWLIFNRIDDKTQIRAAMDWMKGVVRRSSTINPSWNAACLDTYAGLMYKAGKKRTAIHLQQRALSISMLIRDPDSVMYQDRLTQMKMGSLILDPRVPF
jgi:thioredoxin-related protein